MVTSSWSLGRSVRVSMTSAIPRGGLEAAPLKMVSSMRSIRSDFCDCSPKAQSIASTRLLFPVPFGPTSAVMPVPKEIEASTKDLNPMISSCFRCMYVSLFRAVSLFVGIHVITCIGVTCKTKLHSSFFNLY